MRVNIAENNIITETPDEQPDKPYEDYDALLAAYQDSLSKENITDKTHVLPEVVIKAKTTFKEDDAIYNRKTAIAYYDVPTEIDALSDSGIYIGDDIYEFLIKMNKDFEARWIHKYIINDKGREEVFYECFLYYKGQLAIIVVNQEPLWNLMESDPDAFDLENRNLDEYFSFEWVTNINFIKAIAINEYPGVINHYSLAKDIGCVVLIETFPDEEIPAKAAKGVRKTWLEGYSSVKEFYSPDYSALPSEPDYRRTLYWNPAVTPDETGVAKIQFYNNSSCRNFSISAETVTSQGEIGVYKNN
jgi:hypothetical protein